MVMQISYSIHTEIYKKNNILSIEKRYTEDNKKFM